MYYTITTYDIFHHFKIHIYYVVIGILYRTRSSAIPFEFNNVMVELDVGNSPTQLQSMQLHKLLDINDEVKPNDTRYEVRTVINKFIPYTCVLYMFW